MGDLVVELYGTVVGHVSGDQRSFDFIASEEAVRRFGLDSFVLSVAVPWGWFARSRAVLCDRHSFGICSRKGRHSRDLLSAPGLTCTMSWGSSVAMVAMSPVPCRSGIRIFPESLECLASNRLMTPRSRAC